MYEKKKSYVTLSLIILTISMALAMLPSASAAGAITVTPTTGAPSGTLTVAGTGFTASSPIAIVIGTEVSVINETHVIPSPTGTGPFTALTNKGSIKPGSFSFHCVVSSDTNVVESDYTDNGDGTLTSSSTYALNPFVNYVAGSFGRSTTSAWDGYSVTFTCSYTYYTYKLTPTAGVTASTAGAISATVILPSNVTNGNYIVTAFDNKGVKATANLSVVPEGLSVGLFVALSATAIVAATYLIKKPKKTLLAPVKTI